MMILALWLIVRIINNDMIRWLISLVGSYVLYWFILHFFKVDFIINIVEKFSVYFPITITGYLCSKRMLFEKLKKHIGKIDIPFSILVLFVVFLEPSWLYGLEINNVMLEMMRKVLRILSIPLFVYGLVEVCHKINNNILIRLLSAIGESSMLMWFIHGIFFNCSKQIFQQILYLPKFPVLVLLWGLAICWILSITASVFLRKIKNLTIIKIKGVKNGESKNNYYW